MNFVILGCGRVGARLATELDRAKHTVAIIDLNKDAFKRLPSDFGGTVVRGMGIDEDVLREAGIEQADVFAAVTNGDNTNIMASQVAKEIFRVPRVLARIYDPVREDTYHALGLDTICPTTLISSQIIASVVPGVEVRDTGVHIDNVPTTSRPPIGQIVAASASPAGQPPTPTVIDQDAQPHVHGEMLHTHDGETPQKRGFFGGLLRQREGGAQGK